MYLYFDRLWVFNFNSCFSARREGFFTASYIYIPVIIIEFTLLLIGIFLDVGISQVCIFYYSVACETLWDLDCYRCTMFSGNLFPTNERAVRTIRNLYVENERVLFHYLTYFNIL
jgi:hypothetical protein